MKSQGQLEHKVSIWCYHTEVHWQNSVQVSWQKGGLQAGECAIVHVFPQSSNQQSKKSEITRYYSRWLYTLFYNSVKTPFKNVIRTMWNNW